MSVIRVAYVYPNSRRRLIAEYEAGTAPDTHLLAMNHLAPFGIDAEVREPAVDRRGGFLPPRLRWQLREVPLRWELRDVDLVFTPLGYALPLMPPTRGRPRVLVFNFGFNTILRRAGRRRRALQRAALRAAAGVVCLGPSQRDELLQLTDLDPNHVHVALHGVDEHFFAAAADRRERLVLAVGKDLARDYQTLAHAVDGLEARVVFVVLPRNLEGIRVPSNVEIKQEIPYFELRDLYQRASAVVIALRSRDYEYGSEGSGVTALLEAQACAAPVIASDRPIVRDYLRDGETGLVVPPEDPDALRAAIEDVLDDPARAAALGAGARLRIEEGHTMDDMAAALAPLMKAAARGETGRSAAEGRRFQRR